MKEVSTVLSGFQLQYHSYGCRSISYNRERREQRYLGKAESAASSVLESRNWRPCEIILRERME